MLVFEQLFRSTEVPLVGKTVQIGLAVPELNGGFVYTTEPDQLTTDETGLYVVDLQPNTGSNYYTVWRSQKDHPDIKVPSGQPAHDAAHYTVQD